MSYTLLVSIVQDDEFWNRSQSLQDPRNRSFFLVGMDTIQHNNLQIRADKGQILMPNPNYQQAVGKKYYLIKTMQYPDLSDQRNREFNIQNIISVNSDWLHSEELKNFENEEWKKRDVSSMNKQEFKIYMEKCRVPQSLQPIIEQYQHCFGQNLREIGLIKTNPPSEFRLTIARNWNGQPYHTTPYSQTPEEQEAIEKYVQEQLEAGKIEPVSDLTGWNHSCTVAKKKDNEITGAKNRLRVCVDYKPINAVTETVSFAIPAKEEILESIGQWKQLIYHQHIHIYQYHLNIDIT